MPKMETQLASIEYTEDDYWTIWTKWNSLKAQLSETIFGNWEPSKNNEKIILFHLKNYFRFQDV